MIAGCVLPHVSAIRFSFEHLGPLVPSRGLKSARDISPKVGITKAVKWLLGAFCFLLFSLSFSPFVVFSDLGHRRVDVCGFTLSCELNLVRVLLPKQV